MTDGTDSSGNWGRWGFECERRAEGYAGWVFEHGVAGCGIRQDEAFQAAQTPAAPAKTFPARALEAQHGLRIGVISIVND